MRTAVGTIMIVILPLDHNTVWRRASNTRRRGHLGCVSSPEHKIGSLNAKYDLGGMNR